MLTDLRMSARFRAARPTWAAAWLSIFGAWGCAPVESPSGQSESVGSVNGQADALNSGNCTAEQLDILTTGTRTVTHPAVMAGLDGYRNNPTSAWAVRKFGTFSQARYDTVINAFQTIMPMLEDTAVTPIFNCQGDPVGECNYGYYGNYAWSQWYGYTAFCPEFWRDAIRSDGTWNDSLIISVLAHEPWHWMGWGHATIDGQEVASEADSALVDQLARDNPDAAVTNPENYAEFVIGCFSGC
jgi:hypothetical protein